MVAAAQDARDLPRTVLLVLFILAVAATLLDRWIDEVDGAVVGSVASEPRA